MVTKKPSHPANAMGFRLTLTEFGSTPRIQRDSPRNNNELPRSSPPAEESSGPIVECCRPIMVAGSAISVVVTASSAHAAAADLKVTAPDRLRGGLIFQVRVEVFAHRALSMPHLIFSQGWWESMSENSIAPNATDETSSTCRLLPASTSRAAGLGKRGELSSPRAGVDLPPSPSVIGTGGLAGTLPLPLTRGGCDDR